MTQHTIKVFSARPTASWNGLAIQVTESLISKTENSQNVDRCRSKIV